MASARRGLLLLALAVALTGCTDRGGPGTAASGSTAAPRPTAEPDPSPGPRRTPPPAVDGCPAAFALSAPQPWVPAAPTTETPGRLVPDADPVEVLVCRYGATGGAELQDEVVLDGGLERVRSDLAPQRAPAGTCPSAAGGAPHLARLSYADGELWLSGTPGRACGGNGAFVTSADVGQLLAGAQDAGRWVSPRAT